MQVVQRWRRRRDLEVHAVHMQNAAADSVMMSAASDQMALESLCQARYIFQRTLACWASDLLEVQRLGFDRATWPHAAAGARLRRAA